jgi:hypothetical protein
VNSTRIGIAVFAAAALTICLSAALEAQRFYVDSSVRIQVSPKEAEIYVDGYYAGTVDDFDGTFQRLRLEPGGHEITFYFQGYRLLSRKVLLQPNATFRLRETLERLSPGEAQPAKPVAPPRRLARQP